MPTCVQQITWHLEKADLENLLQEAGANYSALEFKMCIDDSGATNYYMSLVNNTTGKMGIAAQELTQAATAVPVCPVPPGCN